MNWNLKKRTVEYVIYFLFWGVLLLSPFLGALLKDSSFWPTTAEILDFWWFLTPAFILFLVNNNILMPFLLYKKKGRLVVLYFLCIIVACTIIYISLPVKDPNGDGRFKWHPERAASTPEHAVVQDAVSSLRTDTLSAAAVEKRVDATDETKPVQTRHEVWRFFVHPNNIRLIIVLFVLVFNICVRLFFFTLRRDENIKELEKEKLRSQLEYLKYQINPHFFMNSLNNIHALVDIDKDKAQSAVRELSGMMRYVLYDKSSIFVPLEKEIQFINSYVGLMRLRYTDKLEVRTSFTQDVQGVNVPSMLFMQFVENAFKHGVAQNGQSVIEISIGTDELGEVLVFVCKNTVPEKANHQFANGEGGVGIENARKRLELLFSEKARLTINRNSGWYNVELKIPIQYDKVYNC